MDRFVAARILRLGRDSEGRKIYFRLVVLTSKGLMRTYLRVTRPERRGNYKKRTSNKPSTDTPSKARRRANLHDAVALTMWDELANHAFTLKINFLLKINGRKITS